MDSTLGEEDRAVLTKNDSLNEENVDEEEKKEEEDSHRVTKPRRLIILEPILLLFAMIMMIDSPVYSQYLYFTVGQRYNLTSPNETRFHKCEPLSSSVGHDRDVVNQLQEITTMWNMYTSIASGVTSLIVTPLYSAATDRLGRRWPMLIVSAGLIVHITINLLVMIFELPLWMFVVSSIIQGLSGGMGTLFAALFSYLADITTPKERPVRIAILEAMFGISGVIAEVGVGYWLLVQTYEWPYGFSLVIAVFNFLYILFFVPEVRKRGVGTSSCATFIEDQKRIFHAFRPSKNRTAIPMTLVMIAFFIYCCQGFNYTITQEYQMGYPFCWNSVYLGIASGVSSFGIDVGLIIAALVFTKLLKIQPLTSAKIGMLSSAASKVCQGLAQSSIWLFISPVFGIFSMLPIPMMRAFMSVHVPKDNQGALFASIAFIEVFCGLIASSAINMLYQKTVAWWPGFTFLVLACSGILGIFILLVTRFILWRQKKRSQRVEQPVN